MSGVVLAVRVEHSTNALLMSTPVSATWVAVALFGRLAVPLVTLWTIAASPGPGASQPTKMTRRQGGQPRESHGFRATPLVHDTHLGGERRGKECATPATEVFDRGQHPKTLESQAYLRPEARARYRPFVVAAIGRDRLVKLWPSGDSR